MVQPHAPVRAIPPFATLLLCFSCVGEATDTHLRPLSRMLANAAPSSLVVADCPSSEPGTIKLRDIDGCNVNHCVLTHECDPDLGVYKFCYVPVDFDPVVDLPNDANCQLVDSESKEVVAGPEELDPNPTEEDKAGEVGPAEGPSAGFADSPSALASVHGLATSPGAAFMSVEGPTAASQANGGTPTAAMGPLSAMEASGGAGSPAEAAGGDGLEDSDGEASSPRGFIPDAAEIPAGSVDSAPDSATRHISIGYAAALALVATVAVGTGGLWW